MRAAALIYLAIVVFGTVAASWIGAEWAVRWFERSTTNAITNALEAGDNDWADVEANGLRVVLAGQASTESARARAFETAARLVDTSRIEERTEVVAGAADVPDFNLEILRGGSDLSLIGVLPGAGARVTVLNGFGELTNTDNVTDLMEAVEFQAPTGWDAALEFGINAAREMSQSRVVVEPGRVSVEAFLPSPADVAASEQILRERLPEGTDLVLDLISPKPVMSPFRFGVRATGGVLSVDVCGAESAQGLARIESALAEAGVANPACTLALGAPSPRWSEAAVALITALGAIGDGTAAISDTDVVLEGVSPVGQNAFKDAAEALENSLPPMFSFKAVPPPTSLDSAAPAPPPPSFQATLREDGSFVMSGLVPDAAAKDALENYAAAQFGLAAVTSELQADPRVPGGWSPRIFAALDALAGTRHGELSMSPGQISLTGATYDPAFGENFLTLAADRLEGFETDVKITVEPRPALSPSGPSARECERQLASILSVGQIVFPPSSTEITEANELILDEIAFVILTCQTARFEIGGHTDSQGREIMNLELSQGRADALRDALISRGIYPDLLVSRGYGESQPIASNDTETGRATNRRIEFKLLGEGELPPQPPDPGADLEALGTIAPNEIGPETTDLAPSAPVEPTSTGQMEAQIPPQRAPQEQNEDAQQ